jgi:hypothetical protein
MMKNLESIETRMEQQWDMTMNQFCTQADQMTTQFQHLSVQPPMPFNLQSPPGTIPDTISEGFENSSNNSS